MIKRALALVFIFGALFFSGAHAADPISLDEYRALVAQALAAVEQAASASPDTRSAFLDQAANLLARVSEIRLPDNSIITVNNESLIAEMKVARDNSVAFLNVRDRLRALCDALNAPLTAANETDRAKLRELLSKPPFAQSESQTWLQWLINQLVDWFFTLLGRGARGAFELRDWFAVGGFLLVVGVVVFFIINLRRHTAAEEAIRQAEETGAVSSHAAFQRANQFAITGDYRSAMRALYLATLFWLDEKGRLRYDHSLTNREYLRAIANDPPLVEAMRPVVETFDRVWYGFENVTVETFDTYRVQVETIQHLSSANGRNESG